MSGEVLCAECQRSVSRDNAIQHAGVYVCARCKPVFVQRLREGVGVLAETTDFVYVGFWVRMLAGVIDGMIQMAVTFPILIAVYGWAYFESDAIIVGPLDFVLSWIFPAVATIAFWTTRQSTPGKMLFRARIVDSQTGGRPTLGQLALCYVMYYPSMLALGLGLVWIAFDSRKQGWHDKVARTIVIRDRKRGARSRQYAQASS